MPAVCSYQCCRYGHSGESVVQVQRDSSATDIQERSGGKCNMSEFAEGSGPAAERQASQERVLSLPRTRTPRHTANWARHRARHGGFGHCEVRWARRARDHGERREAKVFDN